MAYPTGDFASDAFIDSKKLAKRVKVRSQDYFNATASGATNADRLFAYTGALSVAISEFNRISGVPGIAQHARDEYDNQSLDVGAEFTSMINAIQGVIDWVGVNFPSSNGYMLAGQYNNGVYSERTFSSASLATLRTEIQTLIDSIE